MGDECSFIVPAIKRYAGQTVLSFEDVLSFFAVVNLICSV